jgi:hypothetical protein
MRRYCRHVQRARFPLSASARAYVRRLLTAAADGLPDLDPVSRDAEAVRRELCRLRVRFTYRLVPRGVAFAVEPGSARRVLSIVDPSRAGCGVGFSAFPLRPAG